MTYAQKLTANLVPDPDGRPLVLDLFAGCGGLGLGFEAAGFATHGFEMDTAYAHAFLRSSWQQDFF